MPTIVQNLSEKAIFEYLTQSGFDLAINRFFMNNLCIMFQLYAHAGCLFN